MKIHRIIPLVLAFTLSLIAQCAFAGELSAASPIPTPLPIPLYPKATPTPYPTLAAPTEIIDYYNLPRFGGRSLAVNEGDSLQAVVDIARPGDQIVLFPAAVSASVSITTGPLLFDTPTWAKVTWTSDNPNAPALKVRHGVEVILRNIEIKGRTGYNGDELGTLYGTGGKGGVATSGTVNLINAQLTGGDGGHGTISRDLTFYGAGGDGAYAHTGPARADPTSWFQGGGAGRSGGTTSTLWSNGQGWTNGAPHGRACPPVPTTATIQWVVFLNIPGFASIPTPPPSYPAATPTPYPTLTAPTKITSSFKLPDFKGKTVIISAGQSIQTALKAAHPGDHFILNPSSTIYETVTVTTGPLLIEGLAGRTVVWSAKHSSSFSPTNGQTAITIQGRVELTLRNLSIKGSGPYTPPWYELFMFAGGYGAPAITSSTVNLINVQVEGGPGGDGSAGDNPFATGWPGGNGANAFSCTVRADGASTFKGGGAGRSTRTKPYYADLYGWLLAAPHGQPAPPLAKGATVGWVNFQNVPAPKNAAEEWAIYP